MRRSLAAAQRDGYADVMQPPSSKASPLIGWRMLALTYDFFPAFGLWFLVAVGFVAAIRGAVLGGGLGLMEFAAMWSVTGLYAVLSWRRGGATIGMRPWRLRIIGADGGNAPVSALLRRYAVGTVSLLAVGAGFWWAWIDRDRLTWHDRASGTRMIREPKRGKT
jgi:uncharacterized RDD family membrane protein YckC